MELDVPTGIMSWVLQRGRIITIINTVDSGEREKKKKTGSDMLIKNLKYKKEKASLKSFKDTLWQLKSRQKQNASG